MQLIYIRVLALTIDAGSTNGMAAKLESAIARERFVELLFINKYEIEKKIVRQHQN